MMDNTNYLVTSSWTPQKSMPATDIRHAVGIATSGRPTILAGTLTQIKRSSRPPSVIFVSFSDDADIGSLPVLHPDIQFIKSSRGLTRQRNCILRLASSFADLLTFFDDDFFPHLDYLEATQNVFHLNSEIIAATGMVLADGINGPGLTYKAALLYLKESSSFRSDTTIKPIFNVYGCNMSFRIAPIVYHGLCFDELLPLYGWYEDVAFSRSVAPVGQIVQIKAATGIHLGVKGGRQSGVRLGYSQIANPLYLARLGLVPWSYALASMFSRTVKNLMLAPYPEHWIDRRGRLRGNLSGLRDALLGRSHPMRITDL